MSAPRFFAQAACSAGAQVELRGDDGRHAVRVLRMRAGDALVVVHDGHAWDATLRIEGDRAYALLDARREEAGGELPSAVSVIQAIVKGTKFDDVIEKTVELGARRIVPVRCERSYADATITKLERWQRIARAAAQQSRRRYLPVVTAPVAWDEALRAFGNKGAGEVVRPILVAYEGASSGSFAPAVAAARGAPEIALAIGPEGGLAPAEVQAAREAGAALVSLGPTILRTETAAAAMLAAYAASAGWW